MLDLDEEARETLEHYKKIAKLGTAIRYLTDAGGMTSTNADIEEAKKIIAGRKVTGNYYY